MRRDHRLVQRQIVRGPVQQSLGNPALTGFTKRDTPQQQRLGPPQLIGTDRGCAHRLQLARDDRLHLGDVGRIAGVFHHEQPPALAHLEAREHVIDQAGVDAQLPVQPGGERVAAEHVVAQHQRVIVRIGEAYVHGLCRRHLVLHAA